MIKFGLRPPPEPETRRFNALTPKSLVLGGSRQVLLRIELSIRKTRRNVD